MQISLDISPVIYILSGASVLLSAIILLWMWGRYNPLRRYARDCADGSIDYGTADPLPGVSVIVYAKNDADNLAKYLTAVLEQDYPAFEVIVVNDGSTDATKDLLSEFELKHRNLYQTFAPEDTCNVSRKKLSLMLGIKAAKHDIILTTNANCCPQSPHWIASMARNFVPGTDIVIGFANYSFAADRSASRWLRSFMFLKNAVQYLSFALRGKPYRGTNNNLAYRRQIFFDNKGFSHTMNLHYGDDDLFINEVANGDNTRVELSHDSLMLANFDNIPQALQTMKLRYDFTAKYLHTTAFAESSFISAFYYLDFAAMGAIAVFGCLNPVTWAFPVVLALLLTVPQIVFYRHTAKLFHAPRLFFAVPLFSLITPVVNAFYRLKGHRLRILNFTWQRSR